MKRVLLTGAVLVVTLAIAGSAAAVMLPRGPVNAVRGERIPGVLVVNFKPGVRPATKMQGAPGGAAIGIASVDRLSAQYSLRDHRPLFPGSERAVAVAGAPDLSGYFVLDFDPAVDLDQAAAAYLADPNVASVEYDFYAYIMRTPDDPQFSAMRNLENGGDYDIDAPEAWERTAGSPNVVLADTDTGVLYTHEDLVDNIWVNPGEDLDGDGQVWDVGDINGIDDDGNGYVDDLIGWDFVSSGSYVWPGEDGSVQDNDPSDFNGHGTHTSGTIAATTNNALGVSGVAGGFGPGVEDGCKIMCLRMGYSFDDGGSENGRTHMSYVAQAFRYAADNGAVAINYSFGSSEGGGIETATDYAVAHGLVISASAGNENSTYFGYLQSRADVMCVASTTSLDTKSSFSNYGAAVDVSAPGSSIRSTVSNHYLPGYAIYSGTSMAAPHVVGLVGLIKSLNPMLTGAEIFERIVNTTDDIDALNPAYAGLLGSGRINAAAALTNIASTNFSATPIVGNAPLTVDFADVSETPPTAWTWDFGDGDSAFVQHPTHTFGPGLHHVSLQTATEIGAGYHLKVNYVSALAETLFVASAEGAHGQPVGITIDVVNNLPVREILLPIKATNVAPSGSASLDSVVLTGCRTAYFESKQTVYNNSFFGEIAVRLRSDVGGGSLPLAPGAGPVARVWFTIKPAANPANPVAISTDTINGSYGLQFVTPTVSFAPVTHGGGITIPYLIGDLNFDGEHTVLDVVMIVDIVFRNGSLPDPQEIADVTCDDRHDVLDVVRLVDTVFRNGAAPFCP